METRGIGSIHLEPCGGLVGLGTTIFLTTEKWPLINGLANSTLEKAVLGNLVPRFSESLVADNDGLSCVAKSDAGTSLWVKSKFGYVPSPLPAERLAHNPERPLDLF